MQFPEIAQQLQQYFETMVKIFYVLTAIFGIFGAFNVYTLWQQNHHTAKGAMFNLVFGLILAVLAPIVLRKLLQV